MRPQKNCQAPKEKIEIKVALQIYNGTPPPRPWTWAQQNRLRISRLGGNKNDLQGAGPRPWVGGVPEKGSSQTI